MPTIDIPDNFSSVQRPLIFTLRRDESGVVDISINGYIKQMLGQVVDVNAADYYKDGFNPAPLPSAGEEITTHNGGAVQRMTPARIIADGVTSDVSYAVDSAAQIEQDRFLTDLRPRYYVPGQYDELSAVRDNVGAILALSMQDDPEAVPVITPGEDPEPDAVQFKSFAIRTGSATKRYAILTDPTGAILDAVEFIPLDSCPGVRLAWVNQYGVLDYWSFAITRSKETQVRKSKIYSLCGYTQTSVTAEDTATVSTRYQNESTLAALRHLLSSPRVWQINADNTYSEIDIVTDSCATYTREGLNYMQIEYRSRTRRI